MQQKDFQARYMHSGYLVYKPDNQRQYRCNGCDIGGTLKTLILLLSMGSVAVKLIPQLLQLAFQPLFPH